MAEPTKEDLEHALEVIRDAMPSVLRDLRAFVDEFFAELTPEELAAAIEKRRTSKQQPPSPQAI